MKNSIKISRPELATLNEYQQSYVGLLPAELHLLEGLEFSCRELYHLIKELSEEKSLYKYQPNKWSIKTLIVHISDTDKVFQYRALSIGRGVTENLLSYDENIFAYNSEADLIPFEKIIEDFLATAKSVNYLFENLPLSGYARVGIANNLVQTPATIGFMIAGHRLHHLNILRTRYLLG